MSASAFSESRCGDTAICIDSLYGEMCSASRARCVEPARTNSVSVAETPMLAPMLRIRL